MSESTSSGKDSLTTDISLVQDSRLCPTLPSTPVAISMNCNTTSSDDSNLAETGTYGTFPRTSRAHYAGANIVKFTHLLKQRQTYATIASLTDKSSTFISLTTEFPNDPRIELIPFDCDASATEIQSEE